MTSGTGPFSIRQMHKTGKKYMYIAHLKKHIVGWKLIKKDFFNWKKNFDL